MPSRIALFFVLFILQICARVAELVDALDLGSSILRM